MKRSTFLWILRILPALILLQTLFFKFSAAEESVYIFSTLAGKQWEAFMRIGTGGAELIAALLLLMPRTSMLGALMSIGLMFGAIASHLFILGVEIQGDGGWLFFLAVIVLLCASVLLFLHKEKVSDLLAFNFKDLAL